MANNFKRNASFNVGTTAVTIGGYTVPAANQTTIIGLTVANRIASQILIGCYLSDTNSNTYYLIKDAPIPSGGSLVIVGGDQKVVMQAGDSVKVISDTANSADVIVSILEIG